MNEDIKEILDTPIFIIDNEGFTVYINDKINNYITNLQEENEHLKETNEEHRKINGDLRKENKELKEKVDQYENPDDYTLFYMWLDTRAKDKMKQMEHEVTSLKQRNAMITKLSENIKEENQKLVKVIDELKKHICSEWYCFDNESVEFEVAKDILNKLTELKGGDENEDN